MTERPRKLHLRVGDAWVAVAFHHDIEYLQEQIDELKAELGRVKYDVEQLEGRNPLSSQVISRKEAFERLRPKEDDAEKMARAQRRSKLQAIRGLEVGPLVAAAANLGYEVGYTAARGEWSCHFGTEDHWVLLMDDDDQWRWMWDMDAPNQTTKDEDLADLWTYQFESDTRAIDEARDFGVEPHINVEARAWQIELGGEKALLRNMGAFWVWQRFAAKGG